MKKVYICSPYRAATEEQLQINVETAQTLCRMATEKGYLVYCPHLLYPQFLDDEIAEERMMGIQAGLEMLAMCDEVWKLAGKVSEGMSGEIAKAKELGIPIKNVEVKPMTSEELYEKKLVGMNLFNKMKRNLYEDLEAIRGVEEEFSIGFEKEVVVNRIHELTSIRRDVIRKVLCAEDVALEELEADEDE